LCAQDFAYVAIDVDLLASSSASDAVLGRALVAVLQASFYLMFFTVLVTNLDKLFSFFGLLII